MNKATRADINAGVGNGICFPKQHQVSGTNMAIRYRLTPTLQFRNRARRHRANPGLVNVADQPTAVKAGVGCVASIAIRSANKTDRIDRDVTGLLRRKPR